MFSFLFVDRRFPELSDEQLSDLLDSKLAKNSKLVIVRAVNVLSEYCVQRNTSLTAIETLQLNQLDEFLGKFYAEVRKEEGSLYAKNGLVGIRYGLQKHFLSKGFDIINDKGAFGRSGAMFAAMIVKLKREGKGSVEHKQPLTKEDFRKLYCSLLLDVATPKRLQTKASLTNFTFITVL